MRFIKNYKVFESDGDLEFPTKEDIEEIETLFLDIIDEFDLESNNNGDHNGYYKISVNSGFLRINFAVGYEKDLKSLLSMLNSFIDMINKYYPETSAEFSVKSHIYGWIKLSTNSFDVDRIYKDMVYYNMWSRNNKFKIELFDFIKFN